MVVFFFKKRILAKAPDGNGGGGKALPLVKAKYSKTTSFSAKLEDCIKSGDGSGGTIPSTKTRDSETGDITILAKTFGGGGGGVLTNSVKAKCSKITSSSVESGGSVEYGDNGGGELLSDNAGLSETTSLSGMMSDIIYFL